MTPNTTETCDSSSHLLTHDENDILSLIDKNIVRNSVENNDNNETKPKQNADNKNFAKKDERLEDSNLNFKSFYFISIKVLFCFSNFLTFCFFI